MAAILFSETKPNWFQFSFICLFLAHSSRANPDLATDVSALLALKSRLHDDSSLNWFENATSVVCNWTGVTCASRHRRVAALDLSEMGLSGSLPPEMGNLSFLVSLNMTNNRFNGDLPYELGQLRRLRFMDLQANDFSGEFPSWIGILTELRVLRLGNNSFTGLLPPSLANASKLERVSLQYNELQGRVPSSFFNLSNLRLLTLEGNRFSGTLPSNLCSGIPNINVLYLGNNDFEGEIPKNISGCSQLEFIVLLGNNLSGSIPYDMSSSSSQLREVYVNGNRITGHLPENIGEWKALEVLIARDNNLTGTIPAGLKNLTELWALDLAYNQLGGMIPKELGSLPSLEYLALPNNSFIGEIPIEIFNISTLGRFSVSRNYLTGRLPLNFCIGVPNLAALYLNENQFFGEIPRSISNCTNLRLLEIADNNFSGLIPDAIGGLRSLQRLSLGINGFVCESFECSFITALGNCRNLRRLVLSNNPFDASIPKTVGNLSTSVDYFACSNCGLIGIIPSEFGNLTNLTVLNLAENNLTGSIPSTIGELKSLQGLALSSNSISGVIPDALCDLHDCSVIYLYENRISGGIPMCIGNLTSTRILWISDNRLESEVPPSLWQLSNILELNLSMNSVNGSLAHDIGRLNSVYLFDLSDNRFSGVIPSSIGDMDSLTSLSLAYNEFGGSIPESIATLLRLQQVNLSHNRLSGGIPTALQRISNLFYLDVSFNNLSGPIPSEGPFRNFSYVYFESNEGLCGESRFGVPSCKVVLNDGSQRRKVVFLIVYVLSGIFGIFLVLILVYIWRSRFRNRDVAQDGENTPSGVTPNRISYYDIVRATENFNSDHLLGTGAFGSVYKGVLQNGQIVAIKVFNLQLDVAPRSFDIECEVFRILVHRNLCKVITACSNDDFKALVMEYLPNGSLEKWLHDESRFLNILQRVSLMIDIACALEYLHEGYDVSIVHCDVKPSNILLDKDMTAHLSDFGIAKLMGDTNSFVQTATFATLGYIAPEYGSKGLVSTRCDVYSFGIVLMEVFTGKRPSDDQFVGDLTLRSLVRDSISNDVIEILDSRLLNTGESDIALKSECLSLVLELALRCSIENPNERISMKDAVVTLKTIQSKL